MPALPPSPAEMNRRHREFWEREREKFERRVADPQLLRAPRYTPRKAGALQNSTGQCLRQRPWSA